MKKNFLNIGKTLNRAEQKDINGGAIDWCSLWERLYHHYNDRGQEHMEGTVLSDGMTEMERYEQAQNNCFGS